MTIEADVVAVIQAGPAIGFTIHPQAAPEKTPYPFVTYSVARKPVMTIHGPSGMVSYDFTFSCWGGSATEALTAATSLRARIDATVSLTKEPLATDDNEYAPEFDKFVEPVAYRFWKQG